MATGVLSTLVLVFAVALIAVVTFYLRIRQSTTKALARYSKIIDLEAEQEKLFASSQRLREESVIFTQRADEERERSAQQQLKTLAEFETSQNNTRAKLVADYEKALARYEELRQEIAATEESLEDISFGLYKVSVRGTHLS